MYKKSRNIKVLLRLQTVILVCLFSTSAYCLQSSNATVGFESAVLLVDTHTTYSGIRVRQAIYYFDLELPNDVGKSLQKVIIQQRSGQEIRFKLDKTQAYLGNHNDKQEQLKITTSQDESTGKITVIFDRPVNPGNKLTIGLKPKSNPDSAGVYLFGVTAFPVGEKPVGLYLGSGRLHFYQNDDWDF